MDARISRLTLFALAVVLVPNVASAYYAAHMGRWTSRDPFGEVGRIGVESRPNPGANEDFLARDSFDPMGAYHDGMNLYQYAKSRPTNLTDPNGLFAGVGYGKYCGFSRRGPGKPIDSLDKACQQHDKCLATVWLFINPCRQLSCNNALCDKATRAVTGGCDSEWANNEEKRKECRSQALQIQAIACAGALQVRSPITGDPVQPPPTYPIP